MTVAELTENITDLLSVPVAGKVASLISIVLKAAKVGSQRHRRVRSMLNRALRTSKVTMTPDLDSHTPLLHMLKLFALI